MFVKFISENYVKRFPGFIKENGTVFTNQSAEEKATSYGYKELVIDDMPEYDRKSQYLTMYYIDEKTCVRKSFRVNDIEQEAKNERT